MRCCSVSHVRYAGHVCLCAVISVVITSETNLKVCQSCCSVSYTAELCFWSACLLHVNLPSRVIYDMQKHVNWHVCSLGNSVKPMYVPYIAILLSNICHTGRNSVMFSSHFCETATVSVRVLRPSKTIKLQLFLQWLTYSQSVSPVSARILSQPIHSAYLCLPWGDGTPSAWDTLTHTHRESDVQCDFLIQHVSLKERTQEHDSNAAVSLSTSCKTQEQRVAGINAPYLHPKPCWGDMCV